MVSGRNPNWVLRHKAAELRFQGLTLKQIGDRLGVTRQAIHAALQPPRGGQPFALRCKLCSAELNLNGAIPRDAATALCLNCLASRPHLPFGRRLQAFRLAAGLTRAQLARKAGITATSIHNYESGRLEPKWRQLAKLIRALGPALVTLGIAGNQEELTA
jgi:transcriptional regulator with XRE-family HTH domain